MSHTLDSSIDISARDELLDWVVVSEQQRLRRRSCNRVEAESAADVADVEYRRLVTQNDLEAAFRCIYRAYLRAKLIKPNPMGLRVTPYQLLPTTEILAALVRKEVVSTLSLVQDSHLGLSLEELYEDEVNERRTAGLRLAEVSCLADRRKDFRRKFRVLFRLMCLVIQTAAQRELDELLIAVHPRHAKFYQRQFAFHVIGGVKEYTLVEGSPAVLLSLDLNRLASEHADAYERIWSKPLPKHLLESQPIRDDVLRAFEFAAQKSDYCAQE